MEEQERQYAQAVRAEYAPKSEETNRLEQLKALDGAVRRPASIFAYTFGILGALVLGVGMCLAMEVIGSLMPLGIVVGVVGIAMVSVNYFLYRRILNARKRSMRARSSLFRTNCSQIKALSAQDTLRESAQKTARPPHSLCGGRACLKGNKRYLPQQKAERSGHTDGNFHDAVLFLFKQGVSRVDFGEGEGVGDERGRVEFSVGDELHDLVTVATVHTSRLEREIFAVHVGQRKRLSRFIHGNNDNDGVGTRTLPREAEALFGTCRFDDGIRAAVFCLLQEGEELLG